MVNNGTPQYRYETKKVLRGREANVIAKMQQDGWELDRQKRGRLYTELNFRRIKRATPWRMIIAGSAVAVIAAIAVAVFAALGNGNTKPNEAAATDSPKPSGTGSSPDPEASETPNGTSAGPSVTPGESDTTPSEESTEGPHVPPATLAPDAVLTVANSPDLKQLLRSGADPSVSRAFAERYAGRTIEFDGAVYATAPYQDYDTRFSFLVLGRDFDPNLGGDGPSFQFRDVNFDDLNVEGRGSSVGTGDNIHVVAEVGEFEQRTGLFLLRPLSTRLR